MSRVSMNSMSYNKLASYQYGQHRRQIIWSDSSKQISAANSRERQLLESSRQRQQASWTNWQLNLHNMITKRIGQNLQPMSLWSGSLVLRTWRTMRDLDFHIERKQASCLSPVMSCCWNGPHMHNSGGCVLAN